MNDRLINHVLKKQVKLSAGDSKVEFHSGCCVVDVNFTNVKTVEIGEIHFKNFYTATVTVKARKKDLSAELAATSANDKYCYVSNAQAGDFKYKTCVPKMVLMPNPHCETGAQDYFTITRKQMTWDLDNIAGLRLILKQPSPIWRDFQIEDLAIYKKQPSESDESSSLPEWLSTGDSNQKSDNEIVRDVKGVVVDSVSSDVQQMWALTQQLHRESTRRALGRYDVDGAYEINLLSYT